jgi:hypothetical protein
MPIPKLFLAAAIYWSMAQSVYAAHPLVTDDTGTQGKGNNQIELNTDWLRQSGAGSGSGGFTYSYGVIGNLDGFVNVPASLSSPRGFNDASLGVKWRFIEEGASSLAFKPELLLATGNSDRGLGNGRTSMALTMIGSHEAAPWAFHANINATLNRYELQTDRVANRSTIWRTSFAVTYSVGEQWTLVADTGIAQDSNKDIKDRPAFLLVGFIYSPSKDLDLDVGIKTTVSCGQCQNGRERQIGSGLTWRF